MSSLSDSKLQVHIFRGPETSFGPTAIAWLEDLLMIVKQTGGQNRSNQ